MTFLLNAFLAGITSLVKQAHSTSLDSATITAPADIQAGDLLILMDVAWTIAITVPPTVVPTGFTSILNTSSASGMYGRTITSYKIADGSEASSSITGMAASLDNAKTLLVFRANMPISSVTVNDAAGEMTTNDPASQTISVGSSTTLALSFGGFFGDSAGPTSVFTIGGSAADDGSVTNGNQTCKWRTDENSFSDIVADTGDAGFTNALHSFYMNFT